jgi:hypothetical protein
VAPARAAALLAAVAVAGCTPSPTTRGFEGRSGLCGADAGQRCPVAPTPPNRGNSAGCGKPRSETAGQYVRFTLTVACAPDNARERLYYVRLPPNYDPDRAYRTVYLGPGCGPPQDLLSTRKVYPMETASDPDAILIAMEQGFYNKAEYNSSTCTDPTTLDGGSSTNLCHYCFDDGAGTTSPDSVEYGYFDLLHKAIENDFCVDTDRQFYAGYSSGGWMAHQLGCQFPDVLRAQGSVTGGLPPAIHSCAKQCVDHPIAAFFIHDSMDQSNVYSGSVQALERLLALNDCKGGRTMTTAPTEPYEITGVPNDANFSCVRYTGCPVGYPLVFCTSRGKMHDSQTGAAVPGFWEFFKRF